MSLFLYNFVLHKAINIVCYIVYYKVINFFKIEIYANTKKLHRRGANPISHGGCAISANPDSVHT